MRFFYMLFLDREDCRVSFTVKLQHLHRTKNKIMTAMVTGKTKVKISIVKLTQCDDIKLTRYNIITF